MTAPGEPAAPVSAERGQGSAAGRRDIVAFLGALCLFLSTLEYVIPKPVPFLRVGIANLPILMAIDLLPVTAVLAVVFLKVVGQGLVSGTLVSPVFLLSAVGSFASGLAMIAARRLLRRRVTLVGVSVLGALFSNVAQVVVARLLIIGEGAWLIVAPFLGLGTVTAVLLGMFAETFTARSRWLAGLRGRL